MDEKVYDEAWCNKGLNLKCVAQKVIEYVGHADVCTKVFLFSFAAILIAFGGEKKSWG